MKAYSKKSTALNRIGKTMALTTIFLLCLSFTYSVYLQSTATASAGTFKVSGTSSLHDWHTTASKIDGKAIFTLDGDKVVKVDKLYILLRATDFKSGTDGLDKNTYKSLKATEHPLIKYQLEEIKSMKLVGDVHQITATGNLTMAGVTKTITMNLTGTQKGKCMTFVGDLKLKMSDYNIKPPSFMGGMMKTGDEINIAFNTTFNF